MPTNPLYQHPDAKSEAEWLRLVIPRLVAREFAIASNGHLGSECQIEATPSGGLIFNAKAAELLATVINSAK